MLRHFTCVGAGFSSSALRTNEHSGVIHCVQYLDRPTDRPTEKDRIGAGTRGEDGNALEKENWTSDRTARTNEQMNECSLAFIRWWVSPRPQDASASSAATFSIQFS